MTAEFTPEAVRDTLIAEGFPERNPSSNVTGFKIADARENLGEILVEALVELADPPYMTEAERLSQGQMMLGCKLALGLAGYTSVVTSSTLIVITEGGRS